MSVSMLPPDDGRRNSITINGRTYRSTPGVAAPVETFDYPTLSANGWTVHAPGSGGLASTSAYANGAVSGVVTNPNGSPAGLGVRLHIDGGASPVGATLTDSTGAWSIATGTLAAGTHSFSVEVDESAGSFVVAGGGSFVGGTMDFSDARNSALIAALF